MLQPSESFQLPQIDPTKKGALPVQTGFKGCSGIFDGIIYSFPKDDTFLNASASVEPSYAWGKAISVPNTKC
eukprot:15341096-Ditylum_brightwellii.AAC.2